MQVEWEGEVHNKIKMFPVWLKWIKGGRLHWKRMG